MAGKAKDEAVVEATLVVDAERIARINALKDALNKSAGDRFMSTLHDQAVVGVNVISTGVPSLDIALGIGGVPKGRIVEIYGPEQSGKTTLALQIAAVAQQMGGGVLYVDAENALDPEYCKKLGLDPERPDFIIAQPDFGEQGLDAVLAFIGENVVDVIVIDSVASLTPKAKFEAVEEDVAAGGKFVGTHARMMSAFLGAAVSKAKRGDVLLICLNQIRKEITPMGAKEGRPGGNALAHAASVRINCRRISAPDTEGNKTDESLVGISAPTKAQIVKNKFAPPLRQSIFDLVFGQGADYHLNLVETCAVYQVGMKKKPGWYYPVLADGTEMKGLRKAAMLTWLKTDPEGQAHVDTMVELLSDKVGIDLWNPNHPERKIGPRGDANVERPLVEDVSSDNEFTPSGPDEPVMDL